MKEEDFIRNKCGTGNPFKVPEGYFEQFTAQLMSQLPEKDARPAPAIPLRRTRYWRMARYAAVAAICSMAFLGTYYLRIAHSAHESHTAYQATDATSEKVYMDDVLDFAMVSNHEIALYLTDAY